MPEITEISSKTKNDGCLERKHIDLRSQLCHNIEDESASTSSNSGKYLCGSSFLFILDDHLMSSDLFLFFV